MTGGHKITLLSFPVLYLFLIKIKEKIKEKRKEMSVLPWDLVSARAIRMHFLPCVWARAMTNSSWNPPSTREGLSP